MLLDQSSNIGRSPVLLEELDMFNSILVPIDGSTRSYKPLQTAIEMAKAQGARLIFLSVAEPRLFNSTEPDKLEDGKLAEDFYLRSAQDYVEKAIVTSMQASVPCESVVSMSRTPSKEILETAARFRCELIIMATRGETGLVERIFGESVTQDVLKKSDIPVLVFP